MLFAWCCDLPLEGASAEGMAVSLLEPCVVGHNCLLWLCARDALLSL